MGLRSQPPYEDALAIDRIVSRGSVVVELAPHDVGVHAGPGDILADLVDHQKIHFGEGKTGHPLLGQLE